MYLKQTLAWLCLSFCQLPDWTQLSDEKGDKKGGKSGKDQGAWEGAEVGGHPEGA